MSLSNSHDIIRIMVDGRQVHAFLPYTSRRVCVCMNELNNFRFNDEVLVVTLIVCTCIFMRVGIGFDKNSFMEQWLMQSGSTSLNRTIYCNTIRKD